MTPSELQEFSSVYSMTSPLAHLLLFSHKVIFTLILLALPKTLEWPQALDLDQPRMPKFRIGDSSCRTRLLEVSHWFRDLSSRSACRIHSCRQWIVPAFLFS